MHSIARTWGTTPAERARPYACDGFLPHGDELFRGVDVAAPAAVTFRRLCQLRVAPYSYDWIDNRFRRSPRALTDSADDLAAGTRMMTIFTLVDVVVTYAVVPRSAASCRLVAKLRWQRGPGWWGALRAHLLAWGDLVMMRKQLLTLARLAEADWNTPARGRAAGPRSPS
jgi:hypothetical protein